MMMLEKFIFCWISFAIIGYCFTRWTFWKESEGWTKKDRMLTIFLATVLSPMWLVVVVVLYAIYKIIDTKWDEEVKW